MERKIKKWHGGFTLVEVLVVMAILAILAAITVPSFSGYIDKAKEETYLSEARNISTAVQIYVAEQYSAGTLSRANLKKDLMEFTLGNPENVLTDILRGSYTDGAQVSGVAVTDSGEFNGITYDVNGYHIIIEQGEKAVISKRGRKGEQ